MSRSQATSGAHHPARRFAVLTEASDASSPLILLGLSAAAMGGYNTTDKSLSAAVSQLWSRATRLHVVVGGPYYDRGGDAGSNAARLVCPQIPQSEWYPSDLCQGVLHLVDCAGRAAALRHPFAVRGPTFTPIRGRWIRSPRSRPRTSTRTRPGWGARWRSSWPVLRARTSG